MNSDFLLIQKMKLGDDLAIEAFVHKYYAKIYQYCHLHIRDRGYAEDMTQETFEKFFRSLDTYRHYGKALNYLYVLAANTCKDYYKKTPELCLEELPEGTAPDLSRVDEQIMIETAVDRLPAEFREAAILFFFQELRQKEIAAVLGIGLPLVKYRIRKAKELLADYLREEEDI
ncbi:MAG: RNA polymerase sigma factor [Lachnospiraceae bacterium]|nr:RNA polymerase sigma factor [Lachnospiraceae bacterium]